MKKANGDAGGRLEFIDGMRAYAILMMLQVHVIGLTLADRWRDSGNALYALWRHTGGAIAPAFLFASGLVVAYLLFRDSERIDTSRLKKNFRRAAQLLILGYVLQLNPEILVYLFTGDGSFWRWLTHTHVLHAIGIGIFAVTALASLTRSVRWLFPVAALLLMHACFAFGSIVAVQDDLPGALRLFSSYVLLSHASFPVLVWTGFALAGAALGFLVVAWQLHRRVWVFPLLAVLGYVIKDRSWHILDDTYALWWTDYSEWLNYSVFTYYRLGEVLMVAGIIGLLTRFVTMPKAIHATAKETLGIYFLHSILVYGSVTGIGMDTFMHRNLDGYASGVLAVVVIVLFILYAVNAPAIRGRLPFMKYLR
ncbi:MAG: DUF1624 domain-containing protein [Bacteroidetes bacterium]|nr:DUF1624 domain-containing protein [Bacteroidota bacterium]